MRLPSKVHPKPVHSTKKLAVTVTFFGSNVVLPSDPPGSEPRYVLVPSPEGALEMTVLMPPTEEARLNGKLIYTMDATSYTNLYNYISDLKLRESLLEAAPWWEHD